MQRKLFAFALLAVSSLTLVGCTTVKPAAIFSYDPAVAAPTEYTSVELVSPQKEGGHFWNGKGATDTREAMFLVIGDQAYIVPTAYRDSLSQQAAGNVLPVPMPLVHKWERVSSLYGPEAETAICSISGQPLTENMTRQFEVSAGPLAVDKTVGYVGRQCYLQKPAPQVKDVTGSIAAR
jgi:hypothetical protein